MPSKRPPHGVGVRRATTCQASPKRSRGTTRTPNWPTSPVVSRPAPVSGCFRRRRPPWGCGNPDRPVGVALHKRGRGGQQLFSGDGLPMRSVQSVRVAMAQGGGARAGERATALTRSTSGGGMPAAIRSAVGPVDISGDRFLGNRNGQQQGGRSGLRGGQVRLSSGMGKSVGGRLHAAQKRVHRGHRRRAFRPRHGRRRPRPGRLQCQPRITRDANGTVGRGQARERQADDRRGGQEQPGTARVGSDIEGNG